MNQNKTLNMATSRQTGPSGQANGGNGRYPSSGPVAWYLARPPIPGLTYVLATTGYVILSSKN
ncbi:MAG: hypothetical protein ACLFVD_06555 [Dehalococcoidia bacterium]